MISVVPIKVLSQILKNTMAKIHNQGLLLKGALFLEMVIVKGIEKFERFEGFGRFEGFEGFEDFDL